MRLGLFDDIHRRAVRGQRFQHGIAQRVADARGQLAVRIRTRTAFAKLDVTLCVQRTTAPERIDRAVARIQVAAALQNNRRIAVFGQRIGRKQTRRTQSYYHRPVFQPLAAAGNRGFFIGFITHEGHLQFFCKCLFVHRRVQPHRIYAKDFSAPRINAHTVHRRLRIV